MIEIDGSFGEGGGQILRTALTLASVTGEAVHFTDIRKNRRKPGLMYQHLTCAKAVAEITGGVLNGAELNSQEMIFTPGSIAPGNYHFVVGTAGSAILVAQTVLPCLLFGYEKSKVEICGGTHVANAPIFDFFQSVYLPCLQRMGIEASATLDQVGFYPAGGGKITLDISPLREWKKLEIMSSGTLKKAAFTAISHGIKSEIGSDEVALAQREFPEFETAQTEVDSCGPGNVLLAKLEYENITELFSVCGEFNQSRTVVAKRVIGMVKSYQKYAAPVWRFLVDQLLLPMALGAGGKFLTVSPSQHTETNIAVIRKFMNVQIDVNNLQNGQHIIEVKK